MRLFFLLFTFLITGCYGQQDFINFLEEIHQQNTSYSSYSTTPTKQDIINALHYDPKIQNAIKTECQFLTYSPKSIEIFYDKMNKSHILQKTKAESKKLSVSIVNSGFKVKNDFIDMCKDAFNLQLLRRILNKNNFETEAI